MSSGLGARGRAALALPLLAALLGTAPPLRAQVVTDPTDPLYSDLEVWEAQGLLPRLPALQPYPVQMVRHFLHTVENSSLAEPSERARARWLLAQLDEPLRLTLHLDERFEHGSGGPYARFSIDPTLQGMVTPWLGGAARYQVMVLRLDDGLALPPYAPNPEDLIYDDVHFDVAGQTLHVRQMSHGSFGVGDGDGSLLFQLGLGRHRAGPFWHNGVVVGQQAPQAGQFSLLMRQPWFTAHIALYELSATDDQGLGSATGKHLHLHSLDFHLAPWLDLGIFESVVYGGRFELLYFIPMVAYFNSQGMTGFSDNSLVGLNGRVSPTPGLDLKGVLYVDDISFNDMASGNFDTKYKVAAQVGASLSPASILDSVAPGAMPWVQRHFIRLVSVDYTAVTPYTFTHENTAGGPYNWESYTHAGQSFGPALSPNSDRVAVRALVRPLAEPKSTLDVDLDAAFIRHGNASAGIIPGGDGSIHDPGWLGDEPTFQPPFEDPTGQPATRFLTQRMLEETLQLGMGATWTFDTAEDDAGIGERAWGVWWVRARYLQQWRANADFVPNQRGSSAWAELSLAWRF